jgi:hypothetical protein
LKPTKPQEAAFLSTTVPIEIETSMNPSFPKRTEAEAPGSLGVFGVVAELPSKLSRYRNGSHSPSLRRSPPRHSRPLGRGARNVLDGGHPSARLWIEHHQLPLLVANADLDR